MKNYFIICSLWLIVGCLCINAQTNPKLKTLVVSETYNTCKVQYDPSLSRVINRRDPSLSDYAVDGEEMGGLLVLLDTQLDRNNPTRYLIGYDQGPSDDPSFIVFYKDTKQAVGKTPYIAGLELLLLGNGAIYSSGHTNNMFNERHKYVITKGELSEVKQPFYYANIASELYKDFTIYADKETMQQAVAFLPKGTKVTVVLAEEYFAPDMPDYPQQRFLLASPLGLCGWVNLPYSQADGSDPSVSADQITGIKGIFFAGD